MPHTFALFALGAVAICGLPPLNGFASELLLYVGLLRAAGVDAAHGSAWASAAAPALAMIGALAVAGFVKVLGIAFSGTPRSHGRGARARSRTGHARADGGARAGVRRARPRAAARGAPAATPPSRPGIPCSGTRRPRSEQLAPLWPGLRGGTRVARRSSRSSRRSIRRRSPRAGRRGSPGIAATRSPRRACSTPTPRSRRCWSVSSTGPCDRAGPPRSGRSVPAAVALSERSSRRRPRPHRAAAARRGRPSPARRARAAAGPRPDVPARTCS